VSAIEKAKTGGQQLGPGRSMAGCRGHFGHPENSFLDVSRWGRPEAAPVSQI